MVAIVNVVNEAIQMVCRLRLKHKLKAFWVCKTLIKLNVYFFLQSFFGQSGKQESPTVEMERAERTQKESWRAWEGQEETISRCSCWTCGFSCQEPFIKTSTCRKLFYSIFMARVGLLAPQSYSLLKQHQGFSVIGPFFLWMMPW